MIHPLLDHVNDFSVEELTQHITKLTQALYNTNNDYLISQIMLALDDMNTILEQKLNSNKVSYQKDLDNLVNIN